MRRTLKQKREARSLLIAVGSAVVGFGAIFGSLACAVAYKDGMPYNVLIAVFNASPFTI